MGTNKERFKHHKTRLGNNKKQDKSVDFTKKRICLFILGSFIMGGLPLSFFFGKILGIGIPLALNMVVGVKIYNNYIEKQKTIGTYNDRKDEILQLQRKMKLVYDEYNYEINPNQSLKKIKISSINNPYSKIAIPWDSYQLFVAFKYIGNFINTDNEDVMFSLSYNEASLLDKINLLC